MLFTSGKSFGAGKTKNINRIVKVGYSHLFLMRDYENTGILFV
jgi:hypothetical protein